MKQTVAITAANTILTLVIATVVDRHIPDVARFFVGMLWGVLAMFTILMVAARSSRNVASVQTGETVATYRTQAIVGDGNVQAGGDIEGSGGRSEMRVGDYSLRFHSRSISGVNIQCSGRDLTLRIGGQGITIRYTKGERS